MNNESSERLNMPDGMESFSATGKPFKGTTQAESNARAWNAYATADALGRGAPNLLPVKYTDESLIDVPVMRPEDIGKVEDPQKKKTFFSRRRSENTNFIIRQIPRGEYLKYYAKDDNGAYCGTEEPAKDCILRGNDVQKYRGY